MPLTRRRVRSYHNFASGGGGASVGTPVLLTYGTSAAAAQPSYTTAVVSPSASAGTLVSAYLANANTPNISGARGKWDLVKRVNNAAGTATLYVWVGTGTATSEAITIAMSSGTSGGAYWEVKDLPNANQTTPYVLANVVGVTHNSANSVCTVTAVQALGTGNAFVSCFGFNGGSGSGTRRDGWTELVDQQITSAGWFESQYRLTTDTAADVTLPGSGYNGAGILIEIAHA